MCKSLNVAVIKRINLRFVHLSQYITSHLSQLSLSIHPWVGTVSPSESQSVKIKQVHYVIHRCTM